MNPELHQEIINIYSLDEEFTFTQTMRVIQTIKLEKVMRKVSDSGEQRW